MREPIPSLEWQITARCNYRCSYCCQGDSVGAAGGHCSDEIVDAMLIQLGALPGSWLVKVIGGEPLLHPRFDEICRRVRATGHRLCFTTNFSAGLPRLERLLEAAGDSLDFVTASLHLEQVKDLEAFLGKAGAFQERKAPQTRFMVTSVCREETFDALRDTGQRLEELGVEFIFQWERDAGGHVSYPPHIESFITPRLNDNTREIMDRPLFGTLCHSGHLFFRVGLDGAVTRCFNAQPLYRLGNVSDGSLRLLQRPMPCTARRCTCTVPANRGMIRFGERAGPAALAGALGEAARRRGERFVRRLRSRIGR